MADRYDIEIDQGAEYREQFSFLYLLPEVVTALSASVTRGALTLPMTNTTNLLPGDWLLISGMAYCIESLTALSVTFDDYTTKDYTASSSVQAYRPYTLAGSTFEGEIRDITTAEVLTPLTLSLENESTLNSVIPSSELIADDFGSIVFDKTKKYVYDIEQTTGTTVERLLNGYASISPEVTK